MRDQITLYAEGGALYCVTAGDDGPRRIDLRVEPEGAGEDCAVCGSHNPAGFDRCFYCGDTPAGAWGEDYPDLADLDRLSD